MMFMSFECVFFGMSMTFRKSAYVATYASERFTILFVFGKLSMMMFMMMLYCRIL